MLALLLLAASGATKLSFELRERTTRLLSGGEEISETYYSQPIVLEAGHMIFTDPARTPLSMPNGTY